MAEYPRVYREKYWGAVFSAVFVTLFIWVQALGAGSYVVYEAGALFLFTIYNLFATRLVLHVDRIESINMLGRYSLARNEIAHLEIRESKVKKRTVKTYYLVPKDERNRSLMVPNNIKMDEAWFEWMARIPEETVQPSESRTAGLPAVLVFMAGCMAMLLVPISYPAWKFYFDLFHLTVPWLLLIYLVTSERFRAGAFEISENKTLVSIMGIALFISPIYLLVAGPGFGTFVVSADSWICVVLSLMTALTALALLGFSSFFCLNAKRDFLVMFAAMAGAYGYGAAMTANRIFDASASEVTEVSVASRFMQTGKGAGPRFKLDAWGPEAAGRVYTPSSRIYESGAKYVCTLLHPGVLSMRWYQVTDTCPNLPP